MHTHIQNLEAFIKKHSQGFNNPTDSLWSLSAKTQKDVSGVLISANGCLEKKIPVNSTVQVISVDSETCYCKSGSLRLFVPISHLSLC